jgi:hypothetical protein
MTNGAARLSRTGAPPLTGASRLLRAKSDASLPMLAEFIRKDSGRIDRFLTTELNGVLHKEGSQWVPDKVNSQGSLTRPSCGPLTS